MGPREGGARRDIMPCMMRRTILMVMAFCALGGLVAADVVGEVTFLDGRVELTRGGVVLTEADLTIGTEVENLDQIRTGADGDLYLSLSGSGVATAEVHITAGTTFYVEIDRVAGRSTTTLGLMTGSLALKVARLSGNRSVEVRTETTTMGVRGTTFAVQTAPAGEILVTCNEGSVQCTLDESGQGLMAEPGQAVEARAQEFFRAVPIAVTDLRKFREDWLAERIEVFRSNALAVTRSYAVRYDRLRDEFDAGVAELESHGEVIEKWVREDRDGGQGSLMEAMREKRAVVGALFRLRKTLFIFERVYWRLVELESYYQEGYGRGVIRPGLSAAQFWGRFQADRRVLAQKMARIRYVVKLYAARNDGSFPLEF